MRAAIYLATLLLAGCTGSYTPTPLTQKQADKLETALVGKVPGEKLACINRDPQTNLTVISGNVLLYRVSKRLVYRNDLIGECRGLTRGDTLILRSWGSQMCRGDLATSADLTVGITTGSCALGDFTPYRAPAQ